MQRTSFFSLLTMLALALASSGNALAAPAAQDRFVRIHEAPAPPEVEQPIAKEHFAARREGEALRLMNVFYHVSLVVPAGFSPQGVSVDSLISLVGEDGDALEVDRLPMARDAFREGCEEAHGVLSRGDATDECEVSKPGSHKVVVWVSPGIKDGLLLYGNTRSGDASRIRRVVRATADSVRIEDGVEIALPQDRKWTSEVDKAGYGYFSDGDGAIVNVEDDITAASASFKDAVSEVVGEKDLGSFKLFEVAEPKTFTGGALAAVVAQRADGLLVSGLIVRLDGPKPCWVLSLNRYRDAEAAGKIAEAIIADVLKRRAK